MLGISHIRTTAQVLTLVRLVMSMEGITAALRIMPISGARQNTVRVTRITVSWVILQRQCQVGIGPNTTDIPFDV